MYGLSAQFDVSVLAKKELTVLSFTTNTINMSFEDDVSITMMGSFVHNYDTSATANQQTIPVSSSSLMCLIGRMVQFAERGADGSLVLHFDNSNILTILDDSREYESFSIRIGNKEIIV